MVLASRNGVARIVLTIAPLRMHCVHTRTVFRVPLAVLTWTDWKLGRNCRREMPGDLRTNTSEVFCLTSMGDLIAHDGLLSADFTCLTHPKLSTTGVRMPQTVKHQSIRTLAGNARGDVPGLPFAAPIHPA